MDCDEEEDDDEENDIEIDIERTEKSALALFERREAEGALQLPQQRARVSATKPNNFLTLIRSYWLPTDQK